MQGTGASAGDVLVVGDVMVDIVVSHREPLVPGTDAPARIRLAGGGSAANTACWLASMGEPVRLLAARGVDALGDLAADELASAGVTLVGPVVDEVPTGVCTVLVDRAGERTLLVDRGANDRLSLAAILEAMDPMPGWVHLSGYAIGHEGSRNAGRAAVSAAIAAGTTVSVDAASTAPIKSVGADSFRQWIDGASILFANDAEIEALGGVDVVLRSVQSVVVKHGAAGATWAGRGGHETADGYPVDSVDDTGAGDAFAAGAIASTRRGASIEEALSDAVRAGATAVTTLGARPGTAS